MVPAMGQLSLGFRRRPEAFSRCWDAGNQDVAVVSAHQLFSLGRSPWRGERGERGRGGEKLDQGWRRDW